MEAAWAAESRLTPDAAEFVRFCYRRRRVGWPELYDEMCSVASRGLFRGWGPDDLAEQGIGFGLFELPALAALVARIVSEEPAVCGDRPRRFGHRSPTQTDHGGPAADPGQHAADARRGAIDASRQPALESDAIAIRPRLVPVPS